ncbi:MAG: GNAT family N-acetyltransferase [Sulfurimicrobium sp.]|jgi:predicted GNAT family N-acyltransferase|nr:GNAT family N-acetyltransferase [Sulfurimicrobium sp.]MDP1703716.1 GNAT family N-acetyltransferase [Sulfurimicrobium sp.]MDP2197843.1 GNAT family N-acetyltransferase [Sulfurimicrobium sp.]MDP2961939.1 GNAT family N-acetyltransferase [Sulfurimicrobium sp.]MDP3687201.1 GNAT family N-acetyltransferase [Sulfurimicrobium sp.]
MQPQDFRFFRLPSPLWPAASALRYAVFVQEQQVPEELELDAEDANALHLLVRDAAGNALGTLRILTRGKAANIGRVAVTAEARRQGIGSEMVRRALAYCRDLRLESVSLDSQTHITPFYEKLGFRATGEVFMDAGIPHLHMVHSFQT